MFFVFIWICILYIGPRGEKRLQPRDKGMLTYEWSEGLGEVRVMLACRSKESFIAGFGSIDEQFTPYFDALKGAAKEWRNLVNEDVVHKHDEAAAAAEKDKPQMTHNTIIDILSRALAQLPDQDPFLGLKCQLETTSITDSSSNLKKRR